LHNIPLLSITNKKPRDFRGFEYIQMSIGYAITVPVWNLNATTNIC